MALDGTVPTSCQNSMQLLRWVANSELHRVIRGYVTGAVSEDIADYELYESIIKSTALERGRYKLL